MKRYILYGLLCFNLLSAVVVISCAKYYDNGLFDVVEMINFELGEIFWYCMLSVIFLKSQWLNEPQTSLFIVMFFSNCLRDGLVVLLPFGFGQVCPFINTTHYNSSTTQSEYKLTVDHDKAIPFIAIRVFSNVIGFYLLVICMKRFCMASPTSLMIKLITIFISTAVPVLVVVHSSLKDFDSFMKGGHIVWYMSIAFLLYIFVYILVFFLLILHSRRRSGERSSVYYYTLWLVLLVNAPLQIFMEFKLSMCVRKIRKSTTGDVESLSTIFPIQVIADSIMPVIILIADENI